MLSVAGPIGAVLRFVSRYTGTQTSTKRIDGLSVDPELIKRALELSGERTKKAAVTIALQEFIARRQQQRLLDLFGKLEWDPSYDNKVHRARD